MVDVEQHGHNFKPLCPKHYQLVFPPPEPEAIYCSICSRRLEYICPTCQTYVDEYQQHFDAGQAQIGEIKKSNEPQAVLSDPIEKTLADWEKDKSLKIPKDEIEKLKSIPELDQHQD